MPIFGLFPNMSNNHTELRNDSSETLRVNAIKASKLFLQDIDLIHEDVKILSIYDPPAERGNYSLHGIMSEERDEKLKNALNKAKVVLVSCMDKRIVADLYKKIQKKYNIKPEEILIVSLAGGIIQTSKREDALLDIIHYIVNEATSLKSIIFTGHTSDPKKSNSAPCGGVTHFVGKPLKEAVHDNISQKRRNANKNISSFEFVATAEMVSTHSYEIISKLKNMLSLDRLRVFAWTVIPNENRENIKIVNVKLNNKGYKLDNFVV